jgi:hypothetical protein
MSEAMTYQTGEAPKIGDRVTYHGESVWPAKSEPLIVKGLGSSRTVTVEGRGEIVTPHRKNGRTISEKEPVDKMLHTVLAHFCRKLP